ncbi:MAG: hypothetical protein AAGA59_24155 [Actinomycetota bacterium]
MSLFLHVDFASRGEPLDVREHLKVAWTSEDGGNSLGTIGKSSFASLGKVSKQERWSVARDVFGISSDWQLGVALDKTDATPELLRATRTVLDLVAGHESTGLIVYLDCAVLLWDGKEVTVNTLPSYSEKVAAVALSEPTLNVAVSELAEI